MTEVKGSRMIEISRISPREIAGKLEEPLSNISYRVRKLSDCKAIELVLAALGTTGAADDGP